MINEVKSELNNPNLADFCVLADFQQHNRSDFATILSTSFFGTGLLVGQVFGGCQKSDFSGNA